MSVVEKRKLVTTKHPHLSVVKQCELLGIHRSGFYFKPRGESGLNLRLMEYIDKKFMECPFYGVNRMTSYLRYELGYAVNEKRIRRLYRQMGLQTVYPKPNLSKKEKGSFIYPYLLKNKNVTRPNQVWQTDITYIPLRRGFMYMIAIIDVYSRKIVGWNLSNTMSAEWCTQVLETAIKTHGQPQIHNSDQGSQFTSNVFIDMLKKHGVKISMDGKGRALDNVYIERFFRSIKYEHIYLNPANGGTQLYQGIKKYIKYYNFQRRHQSIGKITPVEKYQNLKMTG